MLTGCLRGRKFVLADEVVKLELELNEANRLYHLASALAKASDELRDHYKAELDAKNKPCHWESDCDGTWNSQCGLAFIFNDDGPCENEFKFCPKCGGPIVAQPYKEQDSD